MRAAPSRAMPPLRQRNLRKLVRKLAQTGEQAQALADILEGCGVESFQVHFEAAIVAVGVIPLLVPLLGPGSPAEVQKDAAGILAMLAWHDDDNKVAIAASGAVPLLVPLMGPSSPVVVQVAAVSAALALAANTENAAQLAAAGAITLLVQFLDPGDGPPALMQGMAADTLGSVAKNAEDAVTIVDAGAIPLLVQLLKPGSPGDVQGCAVRALGVLAASGNSETVAHIAANGAITLLVQFLDPKLQISIRNGTPERMQQCAAAAVAILALANSENAVTIAAAGAIPPLAQLSRIGAEDNTKAAAAHALEAIRRGIVANRAAVAAARASADTAQAMEGLGVDSPSDAQSKKH
jgi:vacuolar protein 8